MDKKNTGRLNQLFEKMVVSTISSSEKYELNVLYSRFIDEGRTSNSSEYLQKNGHHIRASN